MAADVLDVFGVVEPSLELQRHKSFVRYEGCRGVARFTTRGTTQSELNEDDVRGAFQF